MNLQEIRDKYTTYQFTGPEANFELRNLGLSYDLATELVDLWLYDHQARPQQPAPEPPAPRPGLDLASSLELIDDGYISGRLDLADATELWHEAGLPDNQVSDHLRVMNACRFSHERTWTIPAEAPDWIRQLSALVKLYMQGDITGWAALKQIDPKNEYPDTVGAILAHVIERRNAIADLAAAGRTDPTILDDGIEYCRICGRARAARDLSNRGLCADCREAIQTRVQAEMKWHKGPHYRKWRDAMLKAMYRLEDELLEERQAEDLESAPKSMNAYIADLKQSHL